ncbi:MAG: hypothetical protein CMP71_01500 [Flavobacteriales bacterium]|nr:hypothetical protein [Flavobacteriales bacterium]
MVNPSDLISIVIPTFNRQKMIIDALNTCINQTYRPIEIIVVDDGSTDKTSEKINSWKEKNLETKLIYLKQINSGGNVARNYGIEKSNGQYIAFLDSDDLWEKTKLHKQYNLIKNRKNVGAVYCGLKEINYENGLVVSDKKRTYFVGLIHSKLLINDITSPTSSYLIKKEVFKHVGKFDTNLKARQDWDMWIRISKKYEIHAVKENLLLLRIHRGVRTSSNSVNEINAYKYIRKKYKREIGKLSFMDQKKAKGCFYKRIGRVNHHYLSSKKKSFYFLIKSIFIYPFDFDSYAAFFGLFLNSKLRNKINVSWNKVFAKTNFEIKSH